MKKNEKEEFLKELIEKGASMKGAVVIKGYTRKDGTEVRPHIRSVQRDNQ
tara:strand:- start:107 stop:256 length:150 start_codon:yes stop_codon:yes gene_type:complete